METLPDYKISDTEERELALAVSLKQKVIAALKLVAEDRKARGEETLGVEESLDLETVTMGGYQRALDRRRKMIALRGRKQVR